MPATQLHDSVTMDDDNAVFASPVTSLTHRLSGAGLTTTNAPTPGAPAAPTLLSDTVRFGIDDSNDSLLQFAATAAAVGATPTPIVGQQQQQPRRLCPAMPLKLGSSGDNDEDEDDDEASDPWVLRRPARFRSDCGVGDDDENDSEDRRRNGDSPVRPRAAPAFCSSPSEPTLRRRLLWSPSGGNRALGPLPLTGFSSSPTSMQAPPPPPPLPPPTAQPRRRSFKRPSPTAQQEQQHQQQPTELSQTPKTATPKRRRVGRTPLGDSTNSKLAPLAVENRPQEQQQLPKPKPPLLQRCTSEMSTLTSRTLDSAKVDKAIASIDSLNLIGNSEQKHSLPTVQGKEFAIRYVTSDTVSALLRGDFADQVPNFDIIDCRYPYEFEGGHIQGAINIYKQDDLLSTIMEPAVAAAASRSAEPKRVLIFHCEFSSERAPKLAHFLRQKDRELNAENYPSLHFPEVYVLQGGYKSFFYSHKEDCQPESYRRMADPAFQNEMNAFERDRRNCQRRNSHTRHSRLQRMASCQQFH